MNLVSLPKVELHVHLAGTITPALASALADRHGVEPAFLGLTDDRYPAAYRDLADFLELYGRIDALVRTPGDVYDMAAAFARGQADQGVAWTEVIAPIWPYVDRGMDAETVWDALAGGLAAGAPSSRIGVLLEVVPGAARGPDVVAGAIVDAAHRGLPVVGVGLMGVGPAEDRPALAAHARAWRTDGLGLQVHAGEVGPPENVVAALDELGADRIAHGITVVRDAAIRDRVIRDRAPLDVCPSSNVAIAGVRSLEAHPIVELWRAGALVTISTDDPPFVGTTLVDELLRVAALLDLDDRALAALQRQALDVSFAPSTVRAAVRARLDDWERALPD